MRLRANVTSRSRCVGAGVRGVCCTRLNCPDLDRSADDTGGAAERASRGMVLFTSPSPLVVAPQPTCPWGADTVGAQGVGEPTTHPPSGPAPASSIGPLGLDRRTSGPSTTPPNAAPTGVGRRTGSLVAVVLLLMLVSGCAVATRVLAAAEVASSVHDVIDTGTEPTTWAGSVSGSQGGYAVISGTRGSGLRLNGSPGADRLSVLPDGTRVRVICRADGPRVAGPHGPASTWSRVDTPDGRSGYMSDAYLAHATDPTAVPRC